jgi:CelD/BcsL family acetyltransferase involved in cellulose biosynthesis
MLTELLPKIIQKNGNHKNRVTDKKLKIEIFSDEQSIELLTPEWKELAESSHAIICLSPEWITAWWKHFGRNCYRKLHIITVKLDNRLLALAPFYVGFTSLFGVTLQRRLQLIGSGGSSNETLGFSNDYGISDFLDILVRPGYENDIAEFFSDYLLHGQDQFDAITFHQVRQDSFINQYLYPKLQRAGVAVSRAETDTCPYIEMNGTDSLQTFIKGVKSNARRRLRQTHRASGEEYRLWEAQTDEELTELIDSTIELHQSRWNELGFPGVFHDPRFEAFFRDLTESSYRSGTLWFKAARDDSGISATRMLMRYNGRLYDYISGFSTESPSSKYRPGIGLLLHAVEDSIDGKISRIELLRGEEGYKYDFTDKNFLNYRLDIPGTRSRSVAGRFKNRLVRVASKAYTTAQKEWGLLRVQKGQLGRVKALPGYLRFRWNSVKMKFSRS